MLVISKHVQPTYKVYLQNSKDSLQSKIQIHVDKTTQNSQTAIKATDWPV